MREKRHDAGLIDPLDHLPGGREVAVAVQLRDFGIGKSARRRQPGVIRRRGHRPRPFKVYEVRLKGRPRHLLPNRRNEIGTVARAAKVPRQPAAQLKRLARAAQQPFVILHPVERRIGEDQIELFAKAEIANVHPDERQIPARALLGGADHPLGGVDAHHAPLRHERGQPLRQRAIAAAEVEDGLVAAQ